MNDDFSTPLAIGALQEFTREVNTLLNSDEAVGRGALEAIDALYRELGGTVLGIIPDEIGGGGADAERLNGVLEMLIAMREEARASKDYALSDRIRDQLAELGITLEDRPDGTIYHLG